MARTVLRSVRILALLLLSVVASLAAAQNQPAESCSTDATVDVPAARQAELGELQKTVESGVFYRELVRRLGPPQSCQKTADGETVTLAYAFRGNARLEAHLNSSIEFSEQRMQLSDLTSQSALTLLRAAEKDLYGDEGCGIQWKHPNAERNEQNPSSSQLVYKGTTCNCQARVIYERKAIVALLVRSAC